MKQVKIGILEFGMMIDIVLLKVAQDLIILKFMYYVKIIILKNSYYKQELNYMKLEMILFLMFMMINFLPFPNKDKVTQLKFIALMFQLKLELIK